MEPDRTSPGRCRANRRSAAHPASGGGGADRLAPTHPAHRRPLRARCPAAQRAAEQSTSAPSGIVPSRRPRRDRGDRRSSARSLTRGVVPLAIIGARSWRQRELTVDVASPTGSGELWGAQWRWWENRPRVGFSLAAPSTLGLPGVVTIDGFWERQSYQWTGPIGLAPPSVVRTERRRAALKVGDWFTRGLRWQAGAALDRWAQQSHLSLDAGVDLRLAGDRLSLGVEAAAWAGIRGGNRFTRTGMSADWRSTREPGASSWLFAAGVIAASAAAPLDLWPGAGIGDARPALLRAHPLLSNGVIGGPVFGRRLAHGSAEYQRRLITSPFGSLAAAGFADIGTAWRQMRGELREPTHTDIGGGIRLALRGHGGVIRVDVARGLRDGRVVLSTGWQAPWPGR